MSFKAFIMLVLICIAIALMIGLVRYTMDKQPNRDVDKWCESHDGKLVRTGNGNILCVAPSGGIIH